MRVRSLQDLPPALRADAERQLAGKRSAPVVGEEAAPKRSKYGSVEVELHGHTFKSKWEARRYQELLNEQSAGLIVNLRIHQPFALNAATSHGGVRRIGMYEADFDYGRNGRWVVEDTKSEVTRKKELYVWKRRHFEAQYGIQITEVVSRRKASKVAA